MSKKSFVILLNGEPYCGDIPAENAYVICCDGAYSWAKGRVRIDENLGDFDSLTEAPYPAPLHTFPSEKDETDGELAVDRAIALAAGRIVFYGGGGKREDHFLGNLHLLYKAKRAGVAEVVFRTNGAEFSLCGRGGHTFASKKGQTVSLLPFGGGAHIMETEICSPRLAAPLRFHARHLQSHGERRGVFVPREEGIRACHHQRGGCMIICIKLPRALGCIVRLFYKG